MSICVCQLLCEAIGQQQRPKGIKIRENKETGDDVRFNDEHILDLSGAIGANSQQEIREHFNRVQQRMTLF